MKQIQRIVTDNVPVGMYLVNFDAVYGSECNEGEHTDCAKHGCLDNEPSYVADVESYVNKVTETNYLELLENVLNKDLDWNADPLTVGDTHDFRPRLFKSKTAANQHVFATMDRWKNRQPWEVFLKFK